MYYNIVIVLGLYTVERKSSECRARVLTKQTQRLLTVYFTAKLQNIAVEKYIRLSV